MSADRTLTTRRAVAAGLLVVLALTGCGGTSSRDAEAAATSSTTTTEADPTPSTVEPGVAELETGLVEPGRYRQVIHSFCEEHPVDCVSPSPPVHVDLTVPAGWEANVDYQLLYPESPISVDSPNGPTTGPDGAGLVLGWTNYWVGINSNPCTPIGTDGHQVTDTPVGPTVNDFVDAVVAHPGLDVTEPVDVVLGDHHGRFFTLTTPTDISGCDDWRPWDPGFYAQGPDNVWDVWAMDVNGFRVVIVAQHFADTPAEVQAQLREMVESIELRR